MDSLFSLLLSIIGKWYIWLPIVLVLGYFAIRNNKRAKTILETEHVLLMLEIPRANDKQELAAEQMFASLHGILKSRRELAEQGGLQEHISFEIAAIGKQIRFYAWVPTHLQNFVEGQIYAQYPSVQIHKAEEDYAAGEITQSVHYTAEMSLIDNDVIPIKTFQNFEVDPLAAITATLAKLDDYDEELWIQVLARPIADDWHRKSTKYINHIKGTHMSPLLMIGQYFKLLSKPLEAGSTSGTKEVSERDKGRLAEVEKKSNKLGYQVKIRVAYLGNDETTAKLRMQAIVGTFKQFNSTNLNGFQIKNATLAPEGIAQYRTRFFIDKGYILNIEELASVFHFPHTNVETPNIVWTTSKTAEPPTSLPIITGTDADNEISAYGLTNFRGQNQQFGIYRADRGRHIYIIGQTGTGKSGLLELLALSDVFHGHGYAIIDPHGDFAINNMRFIPASRIKDVVYFNPSDTTFPMGFNPMEVNDPNMKSNISSEIIGVFKRLFGESWGPRLEYILRFTILALLEYPNCTMLDIPRMLTDKKFRKEVLAYVNDAVVLQFWNIEFASWNDKFASEAIAPVLNKVGAFTANPVIRNIIGQPVSTFNIRELMDEGKILIVNLSKGLIGEDNASILGSFLVTKIQLAAMSRSDIPRIEDRRPFYLYVDEFQNFATDSFATILSEARKYALNLTVANQYVSQMQDSVRDAVFGNVGTMISLRVSADDAPILSKPFAPQFEPDDLMQMNARHFITSMIINGQKVPAFSATTLNLPAPQTDYTDYIVQNTRHHFARPRQDVELEINDLISGRTAAAKQLAQSAAAASLQPATAPQPQQRPATRPAQQQAPQQKNEQQRPLQQYNNQPPATSDNGEAAKKKRRRRKKSGGGQASNQSSHDSPMQISNNRQPQTQRPPQDSDNSPQSQSPRQQQAPTSHADSFESGSEIRLR